jgi:hypothetical protein
MVLPVEGHPNDYLVALLDFWDLHVAFRTDSGPSSHREVPIFNGELASAKILSFKSPNDYVIRSSTGTSRIMLIALANEGHMTANHIKVGLSCSERASRVVIIPSANMKIVQQPVAASEINPAFLSVEVDRLGAGERGLLTVTCDWDTGAPGPERKSPFVTIHKKPVSVPVLYLSSDEGSGTVLSGTSWGEAAKWQEANFPASAVGFWVSGITMRPGVVPMITDLKQTELDAKWTDEEGKSMGIGKLRVGDNGP